jgi:CheY-like chemotaxis protein
MQKLFLFSADDDADDQDILEEALAKVTPHYLLTRVPDGYQLLNSLKEIAEIGHKLPDLVFLDLNMPVKNGRETLKILKSPQSRFRDIPVVVLSTSTSDDDMTFCFSNGAEAYCSKPVSFTEWIRMMRLVIEKHLHNHPAIVQPIR